MITGGLGSDMCVCVRISLVSFQFGRFLLLTYQSKVPNISWDYIEGKLSGVYISHVILCPYPCMYMYVHRSVGRVENSSFKLISRSTKWRNFRKTCFWGSENLWIALKMLEFFRT